MIQLVKPNLNTKGRIGYCLEYARTAFGAPPVEPTAWAAWQATKYKHTDMNLPTDVCVPIWFSYYEGNVNYGHVAINVPGKGIYSSPWKQGTTSAVLPSISELVRIYSDNGLHPLVYQGWSEDISNVRVVQGEDMFKGRTAAQWAEIATKNQVALDSANNHVAELTNALAAANAKLTAANQPQVAIPQATVDQIAQTSADTKSIKETLVAIAKWLHIPGF